MKKNTNKILNTSKSPESNYQINEETRSKLSRARTGKIHVHKGSVSKVIDPSELNKYLENGFERGRAKFSEEARLNITNSRKRFFEKNPHWHNNTTWKSGNIPWNKGVPMKESSKEKMIKHRTGVCLSEEGKILKKKKEMETRIKNFGSLENSYKHAYEESVKTCEIKLSEDPDYIKKIVKKRNDTKRKNNTFHTSKDEEEFYNLLLTKFVKDDILRQYSTDSRYPFPCDFYIKSLDLFIELNLFWVHGRHPFDSNNKDDINRLKHIQSKQRMYINSKGKEDKNIYYNAEYVWVIRDPLKIETAKKNNLNYVTIYKKGEMYDFIKRI